LLRLDRITVEIGSLLLKLRKILDAPHRTLGTEGALYVHTTQRWSIDAMPVLVGSNVPDRVG